MQRGFLTVVSPIQNGANKALKPVRDLIGWFGDTLHAKGQRDELRKQVDKLRREVVADQAEKHSYRELLALYHLDNQLSINDYHPVTATVVAKSPNVWYSTVTIDKGESVGRARQRPRDQRRRARRQGRAGRLRRRAGDLITDSSIGVSARIGTSSATGIVQPKVGDPNDLLLQYLPANTQANRGEYVVTSGTVASPDDSLYPPGIPIGQVTSVNEESAYRSVNVHPLANLHNLDVVQVLTAGAGTLPANLSRARGRACPPASSADGASGEQLASTGSGG